MGKKSILSKGIEGLLQGNQDIIVEKNETIQQPGFGTVENPIAMLKQDHETEGDLFVKISQLTNEYNPPIDACETYKVTFAGFGIVKGNTFIFLVE